MLGYDQLELTGKPTLDQFCWSALPPGEARDDDIGIENHRDHADLAIRSRAARFSALLSAIANSV